MTDASAQTLDLATTTAITAAGTAPLPAKRSREKSKPLRVTGRLRTCLDLMVFGPAEPLTIGDKTINPGVAMGWLDAARATNYRVASMRNMLDKPHVRDYLRSAKEVFRESASAQNISRAVAIRDQDDNKTAAVQAMRYIDQVADERAVQAPGGASKPGVIIVINNDRPSGLIVDQAVIELNPLSDNKDVGQDA